MKGRIHRAPLALTTDGTVVANLAHFDTVKDAHAAVRQAFRLGRRVFISVALTPEEVAFVVKRIDDSGADALAWLFGKGRGTKPKKTQKITEKEGGQSPLRPESATVRKNRSSGT